MPHSWAQQARLGRLCRPLRTATVREVEVASLSQACLAETSSYPPGRHYPGPGLRLAVCRDPVQTATMLTARLTGGAVSMVG